MKHTQIVTAASILAMTTWHLPHLVWAETDDSVAAGPATTTERHHPAAGHEHLIPSQNARIVIAAALSLQPFPADFGNIYAQNWRFGIASTGVQLSLMTAGMILMIDNGGMDHRWDNDPSNRDDWSKAERGTMYGLIGGYVLTKLISAGVAVGSLAPQPGDVAVVPTGRGVMASVRLP